MKSYPIKLIFVLLLFTFSSILFAQDVESFEVNGLKIILKTNTSTDIVAANLYFKGGSSVLIPEQAGLENFALQVAQKATENYPKDKLNATLESMNTRISTASGKDYSSLRLLSVKQNFDKSWEIFADILNNPLFAEEDVELERQKILSNIRQAREDADTYLDELSDQAFYLDHPYTLSTAGSETTIQNFSAADLKNYLAGRMESSQLLLVVVGHIDRKDLSKLVEKQFAKMPAGKYAAHNLPETAHAVPSIKVVHRELPTNYIQGYYDAPDFGTPESGAIQLASSILRDRLFLEVRTNRGLSYAPGSGYGGRFSSYGYIYVTAVDADSTIGVMRNEVQKMIDEGVTEKVLKNKVNVFITGYYMQNETNQAQADLLAKYELSGAGYAAAGNFVENMQKITPQNIHDVCKNYMKNFQFVLLGNPATLNIERFMF